MRALAPSPVGKTVWGLNFYSYASTNTLNSAGAPIAPNADFYKTIAGFFGDAVAPPDLPWKSAPSTGNVYGWVTVEGGPQWLYDGASVFIESESGGKSFTVETDGTGFFGAVDLPPDIYHVRLERGGRELYRSDPQVLAAGCAARFDIRLSAERLHAQWTGRTYPT
jgi:hypothetical protein